MWRPMWKGLRSLANRWWSDAAMGNGAMQWQAGGGVASAAVTTAAWPRAPLAAAWRQGLDGAASGGRGSVSADGNMEWRAYQSLRELRRAWMRLDDAEGSCGLTVVLMLDNAFCGDLAALIRRRHRALRLVLVAPGGRLPGLASIGDLSASSGALGWHTIIRERDWQAAVEGVESTMEPDDRTVVFYPRWTGPQSPLRGVANAE